MKTIITLTLLLLAPHLFSQEAIIGSGTNVNSTTNSSPVNIWYRRTLNQMVYTAAELSSAGITGGGNIDDLAFFVTQSPIYNIPGYTIKIKHTVVTSSYYNFGNTGWTTVKNSFNYAPTSGGWDLFNLDTPFTWDGVNNIVIQICWSQVTPNYNTSGQCRIFNSTEGYSYKWTDAAGNSCGELPNTNYDTKPQIKFVFDSTTVWTGAVNSDWSNVGNWSNVVPNERLDAIIPAGVPNNPNLTITANCDELLLTGTLTNSSSGVLNIYRHFNNSGNYINQGGTISLKGNNPSIISLNSNTSFQDFVIEKPNLVNLSGSGELRIVHELKLITGQLNTNNKIIIQSDANGTGRIDELHSLCTYTLNMQDSWGDGWNGGFLTVNVNGTSIGNYSATGNGSSATFDVPSGSSIELVYTSASWENENTYDLLDPTSTIIFSDGTNPSTGSVFTTNSNCSFSGTPIQGEIAMERYIDAGQTYWRFFSSAVQNATIQDYQDDFITSGYPGSPFPNFGWVSIYNYDETQAAGLGYMPVTGSNQTLQTGEGFMVWSGDTITGTQPFTVDLHGVPNQGDIVMPVSFTNTGSVNEDGWNLIGNPYASTIDWDSPKWIKNNIANAIQILNPDSQQYATYVNGASANGGSKYIASQQAFWVYANANGASLTAREGVKSNNDVGFFKSNTISAGMHIKVSGYGMTDECVMRHVDNAIDAYESEYDAYKFYGGSGLFPTISLINTTNENLTVHSFDKQFQEWQIPLKVNVTQSGFYDLIFNDIIEIDVPCLKVEDTYSGTIYPITENQPINFELSDTTELPRFILHIGQNYESISNAVTCFGDSNGSIQIDLNDNSTYDYQLNSNSVNGNSSANPLIIDNLEAGLYSLIIPNLQNLCNVDSFNFEIISPNNITVNETLTNESYGYDGAINLSPTGGMPPYTYLWNNDSTTNQINNLNEGNYSVVITDVNNCLWENNYFISSSLSIDNNLTESSFSAYYNSISNEVIIKGLTLNTDYKALIYDMTGKVIQNKILFNSNQTDQHFIKLKTSLSKGSYLIQINNQSIKFHY